MKEHVLRMHSICRIKHGVNCRSHERVYPFLATFKTAYNGPKANETEMGAALFTIMVREGALTLTLKMGKDVKAF